MEGFVGVSQQADEGYSEDPLNQPEPASFAPMYKANASDDAPSNNPLSTASPTQLKAWLSTHIASLSADLQAQLTLELLGNLPTSLVAEIVEKMSPRLYIDFIRSLPAEICLKILGYLDPVSLLSVAATCRAWYSLALDRTLWQTLYHYEGWRVIAEEIEAAEEMVNRRNTTGSMHRQKSQEDGHTRKKRAVSLEEDEDALMADPGFTLVDEPRAMDLDQSLVGGSPACSTMTPAFSRFGMQDASTSSSHKDKGKGTATDKGKSRAASDSPTTLLSPQPPATSSIRSGLWVWDASLKRQRVNWQYLYSMRRKLENNWEQGNFRNFQLPHPDHPEEGHDGECIYSLQFNEEYLVSGSRDKTLRIWNLATRRLVRKPLIGHIGSVLCLQFDSDPDEDIIVSGSSDSDVIIWRFSTGEVVQRLTHAHRESVLNVKFDKRILATCSKDRTIKIFNRRPMSPGEPGYVYPVPATMKNYGSDRSPLDEQPILPAFTMIGVLEGHSAAVNAVQIVDNEVVSASGDRQIKVWDWQTTVCKRTIVGHSKGIACVQYDGKRIVSGSSDNEVKVFDRETGIEVASLRGHTELVRTVQAGFGDMSWSAEEDAAESKKIDLAYFQALENQERMSSRASRPLNAVGPEVEEISAYGAKLPPGGGGGKRWGRIVSGSYDKTIIIWRRDKTGKWRSQHHLKQEEAAQRAAGQQSWPPPGPPGPPDAPGGPGGSGGGSGSSSRRAHHSVTPSRQSVAAAINAARATRGSSSSSAATAIAALRSSSTAPGSSGPGSSTRATAGRSHASASSRNNGASRPRFSNLSSPVQSNVPVPPSQAEHAGETTANPQVATTQLIQMIDHIVPQGVQVLQQALARFPAMLTLQTHLAAAIDRESSPFVRSQLRQAVNTATVRAQVRVRSQGGPGDSGADIVVPEGASDEDVGQGSARASAMPSVSMHSAAPGTPVAVAVAGPPPTGTGGNHRVHQHAPEVGQPTRIYKLQYDARRIICCSQTSVIMGWDFCNGDPALEEVARFFATVD
ncbi:hypothetical protein BD289DRAFT_294147 [Coniella lustricola]|uniref:F-box domain-containing protein n=1 Tax=Coniella lustricola TaxID=2025994 RepID=A0A2T3A4Z0_9PEZI|nr:hypothetical protein BD289DRAFT_294147 [Coniella lustricola]